MKIKYKIGDCLSARVERLENGVYYTSYLGKIKIFMITRILEFAEERNTGNDKYLTDCEKLCVYWDRLYDTDFCELIRN